MKRWKFSLREKSKHEDHCSFSLLSRARLLLRVTPPPSPGSHLERSLVSLLPCPFSAPPLLEIQKNMAEKCALLVVDMQNDFCLPGRTLFVAGAPAIFDNVRESVELARSKGVPVIWVVREHHPSGEGRGNDDDWEKID